MSLYRRFLPYGVAISSTTIALLLTLSLETLLLQSLTVFFCVAVTISTWYGELRAGWVSIVFSTLLINYFFVPPLREFTDLTISDWIRLITFGLVAVVIHFLKRDLKTSNRKVEQLNQQLLKETADRLKTALHAAQMGMWDWDIVTGIITWSPEHEQLFGLPPNSFDGRYETFDQRLHPDDREELNRAVTHSLQEGVPYRSEFRVIWLDGSIHWIEGRGRTFYNEEGRPVRMIGTVMAIDQRKQAEIALQEFNADLEKRVTERTAELIRVNNRLLIALNEQQQTKQEVEDLYNNAPCGYHSLDAEGRIVRINDTELKWLGYTREEILHTPFIGLLSSESQAIFQQTFPIFKQQGWLNNLEVQLVTQDGSLRWFGLSASAIYDEAGDFVMSRSTLFDMSERKRLEEALKTREAWLNAFFTDSPIGMAILDDQMRVVQINAPAAAFNNLAIADHIGHSILDLFPNWASTLEPIYRQVLETGQSILNLEVSGDDPRCPGTMGHWLVSYQPILDSSGHVSGVGYIAIDVRDRKLAEAALNESEEKFRQLAENIQDVFWITDVTNHKALYASPAYEMVWGRSRESLYQNASAWMDAIHPDDYGRAVKVFQEQVAKGYFDHEYRVVRPDGSIRWIRDRAFPIRNEAGEMIRLAGIAEDITERQKVEEIKNEFISIVSHELRTPLTAIQMSLGLLKSGIYANKPEKSQRMIEIALTDANRLANLVNDILDLERLESGRMVLEKTACRADDLMQRAIDGLQAIATQQNVKLAIAPTDAVVWAAPDTIIQTLTNLIGNAVKFSPAHSVIQLQADRQINQVLFQVIDQGRGIPSDKLETIFGRFQQVDASDSREKGGTGLGLPICRSIIERHGGKIWAESTLGKGSTFCFTLPLSESKL